MLATRTHYFTEQDRALLLHEKLPRHIAFIPDGNRRWAFNRKLDKEQGHNQGGNSLIETVKAACELNIQTLTFYLFSTENWSRPKEEVEALMWLLDEFLQEQLPTMLDYGVRLHTIGDLERIPGYVQETIQHTQNATSQNTHLQMVFAINYGSRNEICRAVRCIAQQCQEGKLNYGQIDETLISKHLDTASWIDPDLLIRTSGEIRLSNYLLWQLSYSEIHVTDVLWPDFTSKDLLHALIDYQGRQRRLGRD